jgi:hypothetical protein
MLGMIMYTSRLNDFTCLRSACIVDIERLEMGDVGLPKVFNEVISISLGMSGSTLLSTTRLDAMMYGLHWMNVSLMLIPPGAHISCTCFSVARYTHIRPPLNLEAYLMLMPPILSAMVRRYCSIVRPSIDSKTTPCFLCGV